jgi:adenine C2-methylase RlmN of 23S rRNA A2503 and tRNA A37
MQLIDSIKSSVEDVYKLIYNGSDNIPLEVSYIRKNDGKDILCVPTQTSCKMGCKFCHLTGLDIPAKNLAPEEILDLVKAALEFQCPDNPTLLISFMGAGEPLLNVSGIIESAKLIQALPGYQNIRFAISTIIPSRKAFTDFTEQVISNKLPFKIHWSLHCITTEVRKNLMPSAMPAVQSLYLLSNYIKLTGQPVEIHYTLMAGINDTPFDIECISTIVDRKMTIKLLRFSPKSDEPTLMESQSTAQFRAQLEQNGFTVEVYSPPGRDIGSSCGQFILDQYTK